MTPENDKPSATVPFLVRRSEPMNQPARRRLRYDRLRQITQVELDGRWVDAPDFPGDAGAGARLTRVQAETTDDE
jgi:hypothetical protein